MTLVISLHANNLVTHLTVILSTGTILDSTEISHVSNHENISINPQSVLKSLGVPITKASQLRNVLGELCHQDPSFIHLQYQSGDIMQDEDSLDESGMSHSEY